MTGRFLAELHRALDHVRAGLVYPVIDWQPASETDRPGAGPERCLPGGCDWCRERGRQPKSATEVDRG